MFVEYGKLSTMMYEITKPVGHSIDGDLEYYFEKLKNCTGKILEAGVGTGRMLIPFIQNGLDIEGVDLSEQMLKQCRNNMKKNQVEGVVYQGDLTQLNLKQRYEAIIMPTGSFCLLPRELVIKVLNSFFNHLKDEGRLILDIELPSWFEVGEVTVSDYSLTPESGILFTSTAKSMNWHEQKVSYIHRYELIEHGIITETELSHFTLFWYGVREFELLLKEVGFSEITYSVGYEKDDGASLVTFFAKR